MATTATIKNAADTWVDQTRLDFNANTKTRLHLRTLASNNRYGLLYFNKPWPTGASIISAKLRLYAAGAWAGSNTLTVQRTASKWSVNQTTYRNKPGVTGVTASLTQSGTAADALYEIDVTAIMQAVASGGKWFGLLLSTSSTTDVLVHSAQSPTGGLRPALVVTWGMPPDEPDALKPAGGRVVGDPTPFLAWDFSDPDGAGTMDAAQVQFGASQALLDAGTATWDSGVVDLDYPNLDLTDFANQFDDLTLHAPGSGFESATPVGLWTFNTNFQSIVWSTTQPRTGTRDLSATTIASPAGQAAVFSPLLPVLPGQAYGAAMWFKSLVTATNYQIRIQWKDAAGAAISDSAVVAGTGNTGAYVNVAVTNQIAPAGAAFAVIRISTDSSTPGGNLQVLIDDVSFFRGVSATNPFPPLANNAATWWRVRNYDDSGIISPWADSVQFTYSSPGVLTITTTAIQEGSPVVSWTFTGRTQKSYQVIVAKSTDQNKWLWDSGKITAPDTNVQIPFGKITNPALSYVITVRVWDTLNREDIPNATPYVEAKTSALAVTSGATTNVTGMSFASDPVIPRGILTFSRTTAPDSFQLLVSDNGGVTYTFVDEVLPSDISTGGTGYSWPVTGKQYVTHTYKVVAVVGGVMSSGTTISGAIVRLCPVLMRKDFTDPCFFINPERDRNRMSIQGLHERMGGPPVLVTQHLGTQSGHVKGLFVSDAPGGTYTPDVQRDNFLDLEQDSGQEMTLVIANETLTVVAFNFQIDVITHVTGISYAAEFDWIEV